MNPSLFATTIKVLSFDTLVAMKDVHVAILPRRKLITLLRGENPFTCMYILSFPIYFILSERKIPKWFKNTQAPEVKNISFYYEIMYSTLNYFIINRNILTSCTCGQLNTLKRHFKKRKEHFLWSIERYQIFVHEQVRVTSLSSGKRGCIFWLFLSAGLKW